MQAGGARVVPIFWNASGEQLQELLGSINGVLFPGGGAPFSGQYWGAVSTIWAYVLKASACTLLFVRALICSHSCFVLGQANTNGDYFPLWGICQGFQQISALASQNMNVSPQACCNKRAGVFACACVYLSQC